MRVPSTGPCPIPPTVESGWIHCLLEFICRSYLKNKRIRWSWCYELWVQNCVFSVQHWLGSGLMPDRQKTRKVPSGSFGRCLWKIFITALGQLGPRSPLYTTTQVSPFWFGCLWALIAPSISGNISGFPEGLGWVFGRTAAYWMGVRRSRIGAIS